MSRTGAEFFLQEERSFDSEVRHNPEVVGYWAIDNGLIVGRPSESPIASKNLSAADQKLWDAYYEMRSWGEDTTPLAHSHGDDGNGHGPGCNCPGCCGSGEFTRDTGMALLENYVQVSTQDFESQFTTTSQFQEAQTQYLDRLAGSIKWSQVAENFSNDINTVDDYFEQVAEDLELDFELYI